MICTKPMGMLINIKTMTKTTEKKARQPDRHDVSDAPVTHICAPIMGHLIELSVKHHYMMVLHFQAKKIK